MSACRHTGPRSESGLSLIEMMIVMALLGVFVVAVYESVIVGLRVANSTEERQDQRQQLTFALDRLTREASMVLNIDQAKDARFKFDADFDGDDASSGTEANIDYTLNGTTLERIQGAGTAFPLVAGVTSLDFDYIKADGSAYTTGNTSEIRLMQVTITATNDTETISLTNAAYLHNMVADK